jgi:hypothetical protein
MQLHEYLFKNKIKRKDFAAEIKYTPQSLYNYITKRRPPSEAFAKLIEHTTNRMVTSKEVMDYYYHDNSNDEKAPDEKNECSHATQTFFCKECMKKLLIIVANS